MKELLKLLQHLYHHVRTLKSFYSFRFDSFDYLSFDVLKTIHKSIPTLLTVYLLTPKPKKSLF